MSDIREKLIADLKKFYTEKIKSFENTEVVIGGVKQGYKYKAIGDTYLTNLYKKLNYLEQDYTKLEGKELVRFNNFLFANRDRKAQDHQFKQNYADIIVSLGDFNGVSSKITKALRNVISNLSDKEFLDMFNHDRALRAIQEYYNALTDTSQKTENANKQDIADLYNSLYGWLVGDE